MWSVPPAVSSLNFESGRRLRYSDYVRVAQPLIRTEYGPKRGQE